MASMLAQKSVSSISLYRDCLRVVRHMAGNTSKAKNVKAVLRQQFEINRDCKDPEKLEDLKGSAIRGIANYITVTNSSRDKRLNEVQIQMAQAAIEQRKRAENGEE